MVRSFNLRVAWGLLLIFITRRELNKVLNYQLNPYARQRETYYTSLSEKFIPAQIPSSSANLIVIP